MYTKNKIMVYDVPENLSTILEALRSEVQISLY